MSDMAIDAARMMDMLPDEDKNFAYEFIKKLVKAWDPDFTKVTPEEAQRIKAAEESGFVADSDIDWDHLSAIVYPKHHYPQDQAPRTLRQTSQGVSGNAPSDTVQ